jgi:hypothetical protein
MCFLVSGRRLPPSLIDLFVKQKKEKQEEEKTGTEAVAEEGSAKGKEPCNGVVQTAAAGGGGGGGRMEGGEGGGGGGGGGGGVGGGGEGASVPAVVLAMDEGAGFEELVVEEGARCIAIDTKVRRLAIILLSKRRKGARQTRKNPTRYSLGAVQLQTEHVHNHHDQLGFACLPRKANGSQCHVRMEHASRSALVFALDCLSSGEACLWMDTAECAPSFFSLSKLLVVVRGVVIDGCWLGMSRCKKSTTQTGTMCAKKRAQG